MLSKTQEKNRDAGYLIGLIKKELDKRKNNDIKEFNITHTQFQIIMFLYHNQDRYVFQKDVEKELDISKATASAMIDRLENNNFIKRISSEKDSRYKYLVLLPKAFEVRDVVISRCRKGEDKIFKDFTPKEREDVIVSLEKILKNVKEI